MKIHKQGFVWGIAVLVLAILAAGGYFVYKTKTSGPATPASTNGESGFTTLPAPAATYTSVDMTDWKTYVWRAFINNGPGFEFKYPSSWVIVEQTKPGTDGPGNIVVIKDPSLGNTFRVWSPAEKLPKGANLEWHQEGAVFAKIFEPADFGQVNMVAVDNESKVLLDKILSTYHFVK